VLHIGNEEVGTHIEETGIFAVEHSSAARYKLAKEQIMLMHLDPELHRHENTDVAAARVIMPPFPMPDSDEDEEFEDEEDASESSEEEVEEEKQVSACISPAPPAPAPAPAPAHVCTMQSVLTCLHMLAICSIVFLLQAMGGSVDLGSSGPKRVS
jgi:hypothetical protein